MREGINATSQASAFDWLHAPDELRVPRERCESGPLAQSLCAAREALKLREQSPGAFRLVPHLLTSCNHAVLKKVDDISDGLPSISNHSTSFRNFRRHYCRQRQAAHWPACPPHPPPPKGHAPLAFNEVSFAIVTTTRLLYSRAAVIAHSLRRQGARIEVFSDTAAEPGVRALPISGGIERLVKDSRFGWRMKGVGFIAQRHMELIHTLEKDVQRQAAMDSPSPANRTRWWVICDDDTFVFAGRLWHMLSHMDDRQALLVGGETAPARSHLCANGLCNLKEFIQRFGHVPVIKGFSGGPSYALSAEAIKRMGRAIREGRCLDHPQGDLATAACAHQAGVALARLPGGWLINNGHNLNNFFPTSRDGVVGRASATEFARKNMFENAIGWRGQLIGVHKLNSRMALCWSTHGECSPKCDCICPCGKVREKPTHPNGTKVTPPVGTGNRGTVARSAHLCEELAGSTCDFECPALNDTSVTSQMLRGEGEFALPAPSAAPLPLAYHEQREQTPTCIDATHDRATKVHARGNRATKASTLSKHTRR